MAGKPTPDGRRVHMNVKFSESEAAEVDKARDGVERGTWLREAALSAARGNPGIPALPPSVSRPESPGEIRAKVTRAREAAELGRKIAKERKPARKPSRPRSAAPSAGTAVFTAPGEEPVVTQPVPAAPAGRVHAPNCKCGVCKARQS